MLENLQIQPCDPFVWCKGGHLQTLWAHFLPSPLLTEEGTHHELDLEDGDYLDFFVYPGDSKTVVSLFHGLSGDSRADYMQRSAKVAMSLGHTVVLVNHRGAGNSAHKAVRPYHSGAAQDVSRVLAHLKKLFPEHKHVSVGFSMSANILLYLLGAFPDATKPDAAITVNAPIDLEKCSALLRRGFNRFYDFRFVQRLRALVDLKINQNKISSEYKIPWYATVWDIDEIYTGKQAGFTGRADYYQTCSAAKYVHNIRVPTYILTAEDDPFVDIGAYREASFSNYTSVYYSRHGGHLGYLTKSPEGRVERWLDSYIREALIKINQLF